MDGAAAWFGGNLMGAIGVNGASKDVKDPAERAVVASAGWARWAPWSAAAIDTPDNVAKLQQQRILQWATPVLTGGILILAAQQGEQQSASEQIRTRGWSAVTGMANRGSKLAAS